MATATKQVEQIVRKVMSEEMDETVNAIQEISALLTEQVIPRLAGEADDESGMDDEETDEESTNGMRPRSMSAVNGGGRVKPGRGRPNGHDDSEDVEIPEREVPEAVTSAFEEFYKALTPEQAGALAELFTAIQSELEDQDQSEPDEEDQGAEAFGRG